MINNGHQKRLVRYWGSYFKRRSQARNLLLIFRAIQERGWEITLVLADKARDEEWDQMIIDAGVSIRYLKRPRRIFDPVCIAQVYRLCRDIKPAVFHCDNIHLSPLIGAMLSGVFGRVWHKRSMNSSYEKGFDRISLVDRIAKSTRLSVWISHRVICVSDAVREELRVLGIRSSKVITVFNPKKGRRIDRAILRDDSRQRFGYSPDDIVAVTVGHAVPVKGWGILIKAFAVASKAEPKLKLLLVGSTSGSHEARTYDEIQTMVASLGISDKVLFTGYLEDISCAISASDFFVLPSISEGNCNALIEALRSGLPALSTEVGAASQLIIQNETGVLVQRNNVIELANGFARILESNIYMKSRADRCA